MREPIFFHKGLAYDGRSELMGPGYLKEAQNIDLAIEGEQTLRKKFDNLNTTAVNAIQSVRRFRDRVLIADTTIMRERSATSAGVFTSLKTGLTNAKWYFNEYKDFLHGVNGTDEILFDSSGRLYPGRVVDPSVKCAGAAGAAGEPNGTYALYYSYLITWPNGMTYETGISPISSDVVVASEQISWSAIGVSAYAAYSGTAPTIHRKLYRGPGTGGSLADIYYVTTIEDNTTTTYTDNATDAALAALGACTVDEYTALPAAAKFIAYHYGRCFCIDNSNIHRLYYSEAAGGSTATANEDILPIASKTNNWDDLRVAAYGAYVDPQGLISWGGNLYIPLKHTWIQKQGNDPDTWSYKKTWATQGVGAPDTVSPSSRPTGIIALSNPEGESPRLTIFNGRMTETIASPQLDYIFDTDLNVTYVSTCVGRSIGGYYYLLYPSGTATLPDTFLAIDLRRYPEVRVAEWTDLSARCIDGHSQGTQIYIGTSTGYVKQIGSSETISPTVETKELVGKSGQMPLPNTLKTLRKLYFNLIGTVNLTIYCDGDALEWPDGETYREITGTEDATQYLTMPNNAECYRYRILIEGSDLEEFTLYSPWEMEYEVK